MFDRCKGYILKKSGKLPLGVVLTVPFVLQTVAAVGLTGWLSLKNGHTSVERLSTDLSIQITSRIERRVLSYLDVPYQLNQVFASAIASNAINPNDKPTLQTFFWHQIQSTEPGTSLIYGNPLGEVLGIHKTLDSEFLLLQQLASEQFAWNTYPLDPLGQPIQGGKQTHPRQNRYRPWYRAAQRQQAPTWSPIFQARAVPSLIMTAAHPIVDPSGTLSGVLGVTITLSQLTQFLQELAITNSGQAFIMDRSGDIIAASGGQPPLMADGEPPRRIKAIANSEPLIQIAAKQLSEHFLDLNQIDQKAHLKVVFQGQHQLIQVTPLTDQRGLDWLIVVIIPESDFTADIQVNTRRTVVLCLMTLVISLLLGVWVSRWISRTVYRFKIAVSDVAQGMFDQSLDPTHITELDDLASSFTAMAQQLQQSFTKLTSLNDVLFESESRLHQIFEALPIGVALHQPDSTIGYFNQTAKTLLGTDVIANVSQETFSSSYQLYCAGTNQLYPMDELPAVRALQGECLMIEDIEVHQPDKTLLFRVRATPIFNRDGAISYAIVAFEDITEQKQIEKLLTDYNQTLIEQVAERTQSLRQHETIQQAMLEAIPDLLTLIKLDGKYVTFLRGGDVTLKLGERESESLSIYECLSPQLAQQRMHYVRLAIATGDSQFYEYDIEVGGDLRHEEARIVKIGDDEALAIIRDITVRKQAEQSKAKAFSLLEVANQELKRLANLDGLTQVANRRYLDTYLAQEWPRLAREQQPLSLILLDVDFFKSYNDDYGHQAGDDCLIQVAKAAQQTIKRPADLVARYGGEEFAIVLPNTNRRGAIELAQRLKTAIQALQIAHTQSAISPVLTISLGLTCQIPTPGTAPDRLIWEADTALYQAKNQGRNRYCVYDS